MPCQSLQPACELLRFLQDFLHPTPLVPDLLLAGGLLRAVLDLLQLSAGQLRHGHELLDEVVNLHTPLIVGGLRGVLEDTFREMEPTQHYLGQAVQEVILVNLEILREGGQAEHGPCRLSQTVHLTLQYIYQQFGRLVHTEEKAIYI